MTSCARRAAAAVVGAMVLAACVGGRGGAGGTSNPPDPAGSALAFRGDGAPLRAGVYRHPAFRPRFTFRLGEGWEGGHDHAEFFDVWHGSDVTVGFARPSFVRGIGGRIDADGLTPRVALSTIASRGRAGPVRAASLGGRPAAEMSFRVDRVIAVFGGEEGELHVEPGWDISITATTVNDLLVLVLVQQRGIDADALTSAVVSSIRFES